MKNLKWLVFILCSVSPAAMADTLAEVMAFTYENSLLLNANRAEQKAIDETIPQAKSGYNPTVLASADVHRSKYNNEYKSTASSYKERLYRNPTNISLSFTQPIFSGLSTVNAVDAAEKNVKASRSNLQNSEQVVLLDTVAVYMDVIRDEAVLDLQKHQEKVLKEYLSSYRKKLKAGVLTKTDVAQAEARSAGATAARIAAEGQLKISKANFYSVVGAEARDLKDIKESLFKSPESLEKSIDIALKENPRIKAAEYATEAAEKTVSVKKGTLLPKVNLDGSLGRGRDELTVNDSQYWSIGANLTVPLFQSGKEYADIREAKQIENKYRILWNKTLQDVIAETTAAWENYQSAKAQVSSIKKQIEASKIALKGVIREENVGERTVLDVLDAEQEHLNNQVALVKTHRDEIVASFSLMSAIGQLNPKALNLDVKPYDPTVYYESVKNKWIGYGID